MHLVSVPEVNKEESEVGTLMLLVTQASGRTTTTCLCQVPDSAAPPCTVPARYDGIQPVRLHAKYSQEASTLT